MHIQYAGTLTGFKVEMDHLKETITVALTAGNSLPFTMVVGTEIVSKYDNYLIMEGDYQTARFQMLVHSQNKKGLHAELRKKCWEIAKFLRIKYKDNTKKLGEWGITLVYGKKGVVKISGKQTDIRILSEKILAKHDSLGAASVLTTLDMAGLQTTVDALVFEQDAYATQKLIWRPLSAPREELTKELKDMQHLIAQELLSDPSFNPRNLEHWGYTVIASIPEHEVAVAA